MGVPRSHHTRSRQGKGRMHLFLKHSILSSCQKCGKPVKPHTMCWNCGYYKEEEVIDVMKKLTKKEKKAKEKEIKTEEKKGNVESASAKASADKGGLNWEELSKK